MTVIMNLALHVGATVVTMPRFDLEYVAVRVAPYKRLRSVEIIDQIPKSPSGKILRRILVERQRST